MTCLQRGGYSTRKGRKKEGGEFGIHFFAFASGTDRNESQIFESTQSRDQANPPIAF